MIVEKYNQERDVFTASTPSLWAPLWLAMAASLCSLVVVIWFHYQSVKVENGEFERSARMLATGLASAVETPLILRDYAELETKLKQALSVELLTSVVVADDSGHVLSHVERLSNGNITTLFGSEKIIPPQHGPFFDQSYGGALFWTPLGARRQIGYMRLTFHKTSGDESLLKLREVIIVISIAGALFLIVLLSYLINRLHNLFKNRESSLVAAQEELMSVAYYDSLTGLPNRRLFHEFINKEIAMAGRRGNIFAIVFCDLNDFKQINDTFGHDAGDQLLISVAITLLKSLRDVDTVTRFGGDEFVLLLRDISTQQECSDIVGRIVGDHTASISGGQSIRWTLSAGVALYPGDGKTAHDLIDNADKAMYVAKQLSKESRCMFYNSMSQENEK